MAEERSGVGVGTGVNLKLDPIVSSDSDVSFWSQQKQKTEVSSLQESAQSVPHPS
jgi:hypothetical protein